MLTRLTTAASTRIILNRTPSLRPLLHLQPTPRYCSTPAASYTRVASALSSSAPAMTYAAHILNHLTAAVESITPLSLADSSWDNVGLLVEAPFPRARIPGKSARIVCCIDLTTEVTNEALQDPTTSVILCYHPPIFSGLKSIKVANPLQHSILKCIASGVSIFCIHTAADAAWGGTNDLIVEAVRTRGLMTKGASSSMGFKDNRAIKVDPNPPAGQEGAGAGRFVELETGLSTMQVVDAIKLGLKLGHLQAAWSSSGVETITTFAVCAGSGASVLKDVKAQLYITGEFGHHDILAANARGVHVIVCNHSASERPWLEGFSRLLEQKMNTLDPFIPPGEKNYEVIVSSADREPLELV